MCEAKRKRGRPTVATDEKRAQVRRMAKIGMRTKDIAAILGISNKTLYNSFSEDLAAGEAEASNELTKTAFNLALNGNVPMCIFLLKTRLGYKDKQVLEHTGLDGGPIKTDGVQELKVEFVTPPKSDDDDKTDNC